MTNGKDFEKETESRLSRIETKVDMLAELVHKATTANIIATKALECAKSAHHRIDENRQETKEDFDDYKASIRWTVGITVTIASIIVGVISHFI